MKVAIYIGKKGVESESRMEGMFSDLRDGGCELHFLKKGKSRVVTPMCF